MTSYRDLKVWQLAIELVERVYRLTLSFPRQEVYGLSSQMQRAAVSIASNLAEGHARDSTKEFLRHVSNAMGSLAELETQYTIATRLGYVAPPAIENFDDTCQELGRMLRGLQKSLKRRRDFPNL